MYSMRANILTGLAAGSLTWVVGQAGLVWAVAAGVGVLVAVIHFWGQIIEAKLGAP